MPADQIKRCTAPCVGYVSPETYAEDVRHAALFLDGQSRAIIDEMARRMDDASARLDFEGAARYRDRITALRRIQERGGQWHAQWLKQQFIGSAGRKYCSMWYRLGPGNRCDDAV